MATNARGVLGQDASKDGVDDVVWLGRAWCSDRGPADEEHEKLIGPVVGGQGREVERAGRLVRVSGRALGADLAKVVARTQLLARRALLRKRR